MSEALRLEDQQVLKVFSEPLLLAGSVLWVTWLNDRSAEALWRKHAALHTLRIETGLAGTAFHVVGVATRAARVEPRTALVQDGVRHPGQVVNTTHLNGVETPVGAVWLGLLEFGHRIDAARPFTLELGDVALPFAFDPTVVSRWGRITAPAGRGF